MLLVAMYINVEELKKFQCLLMFLYICFNPQDWTINAKLYKY